MNSGICFLYGAGEYYNFTPIMPSDDDYIIAVDGGYNYIKQSGMHAGLLIGDFDSVTSANDITDYPGEIMEYPPAKDYTDMQLGISEGMKRGYTSYVLYGASGGRIDHSIANIQLLAWLSSQGMHGYIIGNNQVLTSITDSVFLGSSTPSEDRCLDLFAPVAGRYISVFSHSDTCEGVTITGLGYNTEHITLTNRYPLGVSNNFTGTDYSISVEHGTLIIVAEH